MTLLNNSKLAQDYYFQKESNIILPHQFSSFLRMNPKKVLPTKDGHNPHPCEYYITTYQNESPITSITN